MMHQPQTFLGTRGDQVISGLTVRDIYLLVRARLEYYLQSEFDPDAVCQNICCEVEEKMGIFPNVPPLIEKDKS